MQTFQAVEVADERLKPTPTPEEAAELILLAAEEGEEAAEERRLEMGVKKPEPTPPVETDE